MQKLMRMIHKEEKGFTLVELMVVVVIIGILVAIAIPIYGSVQDNAHEKAAEAEHRIVIGAVQMYQASTSDQTVPTADGDIDPYLEGGVSGLDLTSIDYTVADEVTITTTAAGTTGTVHTTTISQ